MLHRELDVDAVLVDALAVGRNERGHELGAGAPSVVLRQVTGIDGEVELYRAERSGD